MFGHRNDDSSQQDDNNLSEEAIHGIVGTEAPSHDGVLDNSHAPTTNDTPVTHPGPVSDDDNAWQHPGVPTDNAPASISDVVTPLSASSAPAYHPADTPHGDPAHDDNQDEVPSAAHSDLIDIRHKALGELSPIVGHLDQTPEDKFRTTMMMIQASDDQSLVKTAYEAAKEIKDDKVRAQALLDIVNEINYFTQSETS